MATSNATGVSQLTESLRNLERVRGASVADGVARSLSMVVDWLTRTPHRGQVELPVFRHRIGVMKFKQMVKATPDHRPPDAMMTNT